MEENNLTLDQELMQADPANPDANLASKGKRFANMIVDVIAYYVLAAILGGIFGVLGLMVGMGNASQGIFFLLALGIIFFYYSVLESRTGKTIGKMITKTRVVDEHGNKITFSKAAIRSLCRFIPFEAFTFLNKTGVGLHDSISKTRVINDR